MPEALLAESSGVRPEHLFADQTLVGRALTILCNTAVQAYLRDMPEMTVSEARACLGDVVDAARTTHDPVFLTRHGRWVAAVIDADVLERLLAAAEDLAEIVGARGAREEIAAGDAAIPWEPVKADLGLA